MNTLMPMIKEGLVFFKAKNGRPELLLLRFDSQEITKEQQLFCQPNCNGKLVCLDARSKTMKHVQFFSCA